MFECVTCFLLLFSHLAAPALCGVKMRDPENEVADFRSVNTSDSSGVVKRQSSQVHGCHCPGDMAVRMRKVLARPRVDVRVCHLLFIVVLTSCSTRSMRR